MTGFNAAHADALIAAYRTLESVPTGEHPAEHLYRNWYAAPAPADPDPGPWTAPIAWSARAAHGATQHWSAEPVEVLAIGLAGVVVVGAGTGRRALCRGDYLTVAGRPGFPPRVGDRVRVVERLGAIAQDGWWRTWGAAWNPRRLPASVTRVYLHPRPGAGPRLVHAVTTVLAGTDQWCSRSPLLPVASPGRMPLSPTSPVPDS